MLENKEAIKAKWDMPKGHGNQLEGNSTGQRWGTLNIEPKKKEKIRTSLVVQWLRPQASTAGGAGSASGLKS